MSPSLASPQTARRRLLVRVLALSVSAGAIVACGSRTGLFGPEGVDETGPAADAGLEAGPQPIPCVPGRFTFELAVAQLMFVVDRSGSMAFDLAGNGQDSVPPVSVPDDAQRWRILQRALAQTITAFDREISMGAKFFPEVLAQSTSDNGACRVDTGVGIPPARGNAQRILDIFDTTRPLGGTPTSDAVRIAAQYLTESRSVARTIVLATDGEPNCNDNLDARNCVCTSPRGCSDQNPSACLDDLRTVETIRDVAETQKIPVYVIGIGAEEASAVPVLDRMAVAGGRPLPGEPRFYGAQSEDALDQALASIRDAVAKCTYLTPSAPSNPDAITVSIGGVQIPRDPSKTDGWDWIDQTYGELAYFGDACTQAQGTSQSGGTPAVVSGIVRCN
jgi:hypothetical protein